MTDITTNTDAIEATETSLDDFSADFFSDEKAAVEETTEETETPEEDTEAPVEAQDTDETETPEEDEAEEVDEPEVKEKPKSRTQKRFDELSAKIREKDEALAAALARLDKLEKGDSKEPTDTPQNTKEPEGLVEPTADDLLEDGSPKYPLGEFDPKLLRDLTRYDRAVERAHEEKVNAEQKAEREQSAKLNELQTNWNEKVEVAKTTYPDYVEKGQALLEELSDIPTDLAVYLTQNIMSLDYGTDVFYYLAEHPEEARAIVESSPEKALTRLGRIEARFEIAADELSGKETKLRTTKAPEPPTARNRGVNASAPVDLNNIDLDSFDKIFNQKK